MSNLFDAKTRAAVTARVERFRPDSARVWGRMTAHQAICHLSDAFRMSLNERPAAPVNSAFKPVIKFIALRLPLAWPRGRIQTVPEAEQGVGGTPPLEFARDRDDLIALIERVGAAGAGQLCRTHPIFGAMTADLWGIWAYRHLDHHLRQFNL